MPAAIVVDNVSKKYLIGLARYSSLRDTVTNTCRRVLGRPLPETARTREFWALKDVSFEVEKGTTLGIIGPNGAGKSTLLKLISRVSKPTKGTITTHGRVSALIEVGAGFHPELTGRENVYLNGSILGMMKREIDKKFDAIVDFSGIEEFIDTPVKYYSSGMYARLGFSVAAHVDPDILLVDEVLSVGDWGFQQKCLERMQEIVAAGVTVVFVSHNMSAVTRLCKKSAVLDAGKCIYSGDTEGAISAYERVAIGIARRKGGSRVNESQRAEVEMLSLDLHNHSGVSTHSLRTGQPFEIVLKARWNVPCDEPIMVIAIRDKQGMLVFRTDSRVAGCPISSVTSNQVVIVRMRGRMNFLSGRYGLHIGMETSDHERALSVSNGDLYFLVPEYPVAEGTANLDLEMHIGDRQT
jgi:lipopolysaccharide transport system ATP-binding protein